MDQKKDQKNIFESQLPQRIEKSKLQQSSMTRELISGSFEIVGDIAIIKVPSSLAEQQSVLSTKIMATHRNVRTVLNQTNPVFGEYRLRRLDWVVGERKSHTLHKEHGCLFRVDLSEVYFSPRLAFERMRVAKLVKDGEVIVNMFAGVGCFSIIIAKYSKASRIYSIDINPRAISLMEENIRLNKLEDRVTTMMGDAKEVLEKQFPDPVDRILMPLPSKAFEYLDAACLILKPRGFIHYYDFIHTRDREHIPQKVVEKVNKKLVHLNRRYEVGSSRSVRTVGPNWYQVVLDLQVE